MSVNNNTTALTLWLAILIALVVGMAMFWPFSKAEAAAYICNAPLNQQHVCGQKVQKKYKAQNTKKVYATATVPKPNKVYKAKKKSKAKKVVYTTSTGKTLYGLASYYWQPQPVASGGRFNPNALTAAHKSLPFGTKVRVTNKRNGKSVVVKINDRGPYIKGRIIDLSKRAAGVISMQKAGVVPVSVTILGKG